MKRTLEQMQLGRGKGLCFNLNLDKGTDFDCEMQRFITLCRDLEPIDAAKVKEAPQTLAPKADAAFTEIRKLLRYVTYRIELNLVRFEGDPPGIGFRFENAHIPQPGSLPKSGSQEWWRWVRTTAGKPSTIVQVLELVRAGAIDRLRRCASCSDWFFAERNDQRFCSTVCRRHTFNTSPEQRIDNAKYQRDRYKREKGKVIQWAAEAYASLSPSQQNRPAFRNDRILGRINPRLVEMRREPKTARWVDKHVAEIQKEAKRRSAATMRAARASG